MRRIGLLAAIALFAGCDTPPPSAFVAGGRDSPAAVAIGTDAAGEACTMIRTGSGADIICGGWDSPAARVREAPAAASATLAGNAQAQLTCGAPANTTILGSQAATLLDCRRRNGGWPAFALAASVDGKTWQADGVLPALPAAERAIGVLSGRTRPDQAIPASAALDRVAARLAREAFATGDIAQYETLMAVGRDANQAERFAAAETAYRAALALQERLQGANASDTFAPLVRLALQVSNQGRFPEAEVLFDRAAALAPRAADPLAGAIVLHHRGLHLANRGKNDEALAMLARAEAAYQAQVPPGALVAQPAGFTGSELALDVVQTRAIVGMVESRRNRAAVLRVAGRTEESAALAREATLLAARSPGAARTDVIAARLARTAGAASAAAGADASANRDFAQAAARFARGLPRSRPYADTLLLRAGTASPTDVAALCRDALAVLRELREGTTPARIAPCVDAFAAAGDQASLAQGFEATQLAQGGVTATQIARAAARLGQSSRNPAVSEAIRNREDSQAQLVALFRRRDAVIDGRATGGQAELTALDAQIAAAEVRFADADAAAQAAAPGYPQLVQSVTGASDVLKALRPGEALAATFVPPGERRGWTFVLADGRIHAARIAATEREIAVLVGRIRAGVESGDDSKPFDAAAAHALYRALFADVATPIEAATSLVVAPAGPLLSIPFGLLVEAAPPRPDSHAGARFLIARLPISHVPAAASLVSLRRAGPSRAPRPWFGFGDPRPVPASTAARSFPAAPDCGRLLSLLPPLPTAEVELRASAAFFDAGPQQIRSGAAFTVPAVERVNLRDYRILHFATHGLLPSELACLSDPTIVASVPAGARDAGGALLTSGAVLDLDLDADVVVLSACNTGGGSTGGESLSTLARAFFYAGARSLLVTHWYVNDVAATRIVALALRNVSQGQGFAEALRAAQLDFMALPGGGHPALWAPFALVGVGPEARTSRL